MLAVVLHPVQDGAETAPEIDVLLSLADLVTRARTAVQRDFQGNPEFAHDLEMPTRFAKQLVQIVRGALAIGMSREAALRVGGTYTPDPMSIPFEAPARQLLARAYARPGRFVTTPVWANPGPQAQAYAAAHGVTGDLLGPDPVHDGSGGLNCRTRWARAFIRAVYREHKHGRGYGAIHPEVGRYIPASPQYDPDNPSAGGFPPGRAIRIMYQPSNAKAREYMARQPDSAKAFDPNGYKAGRYSDPSKRDW